MSIEKYFKLKEVVLYIFGLFIFINFGIAENLYYLMCLFLVIDIFYYKNKLECGNEKIKKIILFIVIFGTCWNYFADFNYRAARAFFKINRYFFFVFYLYPLIKKDKNILKNFFISMAGSYFILFLDGVNTYFIKKNAARYGGFYGIMVTALISSMIGAFSFINLILAKLKIEKFISGVIFFSSIFLLVISQTRAALLALVLAILCGIILTKNIKIIILTIVTGLISLGIFWKTPQAERFKSNTFNTKVSLNNMSNGLRVEMWKNAIWRYKQHYITGTGTKQDKKLFDEYVRNMKETTETEKRYKETFIRGFDDAHSMYLNNLVYNGIFAFFQFFFALVLIPMIVLKNYYSKYSLPILSTWITYHIYAVVWSLNRGGSDPLIYWIMIGIILSCPINNEKNIEVK